MYDIHSHILPGVDDGPYNVEDVLEIAYAAEQAGIEAIACTPHYLDGEYNNSSENNQAVLNNLKTL